MCIQWKKSNPLKNQPLSYGLIVKDHISLPFLIILSGNFFWTIALNSSFYTEVEVEEGDDKLSDGLSNICTD